MQVPKIGLELSHTLECQVFGQDKLMLCFLWKMKNLS